MAKRPGKKRIWLGIAALLLLCLLVWTLWSNTAPVLTCYTITSSRLPEAFHGFRIAQISDLHNAEMGEDNEKLLSLLRESRPNIIVFTGDLIDSRRTDLQVALDFARSAVQIAPCYFVTGNHEARKSEEFLLQMEEALARAGVTVLRNEMVTLSIGDAQIYLGGIDDPFLGTREEWDNMWQSMDTIYPEEGFRILLAHRPEHFQRYCQADIDLALTGHVHGGQFRLPFLGGLFGPGQGLFPKYDSGVFTQENTHMVVSRGIGNSLIPLRFNNRPEVVLVVLEREREP